MTSTGGVPHRPRQWGRQEKIRDEASRRESGGSSGGTFEPFGDARGKWSLCGVDRGIHRIGQGQLQAGDQSAWHVAEDISRAAMMLCVVAGQLRCFGIVAGRIMMMRMFVGDNLLMLVRCHAASRFPAETRRENSQQHDHDQQAGNESSEHLHSTIAWTNYTIMARA